MDQRQAGWILAVGGGLIALGSFLPWATMTTVFGKLSVSGTDGGGDGVITLVAGLGIALPGVLFATGAYSPSVIIKTVVLVLLAVVATVWWVDFNNIGDVLDQASDDVAQGSVGIGMWVLIIGVGVGLLGILAAPNRATEVAEAEA